MLALQDLQDLLSVHAGHLQIQKGKIEPPRFGCLDRVGAARYGGHVESALLKLLWLNNC